MYIYLPSVGVKGEVVIVVNALWVSVHEDSWAYIGCIVVALAVILVVGEIQIGLLSRSGVPSLYDTTVFIQT